MLDTVSGQEPNADISTSELHSVNDLFLLRAEQAKLLQERVVGSCMIVMFIIAYTTALLAFVRSLEVASIWFALGSTMVLVTFLYARLAVGGPVTSENSRRFLIGHCIVSACTGAAWSGFAIWQLDYDQYFTLFFGLLTAGSITLGGVVPRSAYRPTYVALASTAIMPYAIYILITAPGEFSLIGVALLVYFLFLMSVSAKVEIDTRETIASKNAHQLNEMILARNKVYRDANADKMRFMSGVAHDFAQPLNAQGFFIAGLRASMQTTEQHELLDRIDECVQSQRSMLRGLTEISRLEHGNTELRVEVVDLEALCESSCEQVRALGTSGAPIETDLLPVEVTTDPALLSRILRNLISNALKFTPANGRIELLLKPDAQGLDNQGAVIEVADTGPGIADVDKERIFGEFTQLEPETQSKVGLGLGLSIVKRLCETLEIDIECRSQAGKGTRFILTIPPDLAEDAVARVDIQDVHPFEQKPMVLVADQDRASLEAIAAALRGWDCTVITAKSKSEALDALNHCEIMPALMIVDRKIDIQNGLDTISQIRDEFNAEIPAVLIGDFHKKVGNTHELAKVISLSKPIDPKAIWLAMQEQLFAGQR